MPTYLLHLTLCTSAPCINLVHLLEYSPSESKAPSVPWINTRRPTQGYSLREAVYNGLSQSALDAFTTLTYAATSCGNMHRPPRPPRHNRSPSRLPGGPAARAAANTASFPWLVGSNTDNDKNKRITDDRGGGAGNNSGRFLQRRCCYRHRYYCYHYCRHGASNHGRPDGGGGRRRGGCVRHALLPGGQAALRLLGGRHRLGRQQGPRAGGDGDGARSL